MRGNSDRGSALTSVDRERASAREADATDYGQPVNWISSTQMSNFAFFSLTWNWMP
jgi:hypothetical protein